MFTKITASTEHINAQSGFNGVLPIRGVVIWIPIFQHSDDVNDVKPGQFSLMRTLLGIISGKPFLHNQRDSWRNVAAHNEVIHPSAFSSIIRNAVVVDFHNYVQQNKHKFSYSSHLQYDSILTSTHKYIYTFFIFPQTHKNKQRQRQQQQQQQQTQQWQTGFFIVYNLAVA